MNPLVLFDYIFFRTAEVYDRKFGHREAKKLSSILILSLIQFVNILDLLNLFNLSDNVRKTFPKYSFFIVVTLLCGLNYIRYIKILNYSVLEAKWKNEQKVRRRIYCVLIIIYLVLSFYFVVPR